MAPRKLPVVQNQSPEDATAEQRPVWHWTMIGAGFVFTFWIPLVMLALWVGKRLVARVVGSAEPERVAEHLAGAGEEHRWMLSLVVIGPIVLSFVVACLAGGALVGRFGGRASPKHAATGGMAAAVLIWTIALLSGAVLPWPLALASLLALAPTGALGAAAGAKLGMKRRRPSPPSPE